MTTLNLSVGASGDDGYVVEAASPTIDTSMIFTEQGCDGSEAYHAWYRWTGATVEGTIDASYIEITEHNWYGSGGTPELRIYGVDEDNPAAPTTYQEFADDPETTESVEWDGVWANASAVQSGSLNLIFQELVDSYTISNDAVMVKVKNDKTLDGTHKNMGVAYDCTTYTEAQLHIDYTAGGVTTRRYGLTVLGVG